MSDWTSKEKFEGLLKEFQLLVIRFDQKSMEADNNMLQAENRNDVNSHKANLVLKTTYDSVVKDCTELINFYKNK